MSIPVNYNLCLSNQSSHIDLFNHQEDNILYENFITYLSNHSEVSNIFVNGKTIQFDFRRNKKLLASIQEHKINFINTNSLKDKDLKDIISLKVNFSKSLGKVDKLEVKKEEKKKQINLFKNLNVQESMFNKIFFEKLVNIMPVGTGKTFSCAHAAVEQIIKRAKNQDNSLLIITTMSNSLIDSLIDEIAHNISIISKGNNCPEIFESIVTDLRNKTNIYHTLNKIGIVLLNRKNSMSFREEHVKSAAVILTNHAYSFPHGHTDKYNSNIYKVLENIKEDGREVKKIFDEFDQFHRMGIEEIPINYYLGNNFADETRNQKQIAYTAFNYCQKKYVLSKRRELLRNGQYENNFVDDYYYKLPDICFNKELIVRDEDGIKEFINSIKGEFNFKELVLDNIYETSEKYYADCSRRGKKRGDYYFKKVEEISRYNVKKDRIISIKDDAVGKLLSINESIIFRTQKLEVYSSTEDGKEGEFLQRFNTPQQVLDFAIENLSKEDWINLYNAIAAEMKDLYIMKMIIRKKPFNFMGQKNFYVTATKSVLEELGYKITTKTDIKKITSLEKIDIFVLQNKQNSLSDQKEFFKLLKEYKDIESFAVCSKKEQAETFIEEHHSSKEFSNVDIVLKKRITDIGRIPSDPSRNLKNVTMVYQKGDQTQGTNYKKHIIMFQDGHCKIDTIERIVPIEENKIEIIDYNKASLRSFIQSTGRIFRGSKKYKALIFFCDMQDNEEIEVLNKLMEEIIKQGFEVNPILIEKDITKKEEKQKVFKNILDHIETRNNFYNYNQGEINYSFSLVDGRKTNAKKFDSEELKQVYLTTREQMFKSTGKYPTDKAIYNDLSSMIDISERRFKEVVVNWKKKISKNELKAMYLKAQKIYLKNNPEKKKLSFREAQKLLGFQKDMIQRAVSER